jgi:oligoribonuclease
MKPTRRVHDCLDRDIAEYRHYLTLMTGPALADESSTI